MARNYVQLFGGWQKVGVALTLAAMLLLALWCVPLAVPVAIAGVTLSELGMRAYTTARSARTWLLAAGMAFVVLAGSYGMATVLMVPHGRMVFLAFAIVVAVTDIAAQVIGRKFGTPGTFMPRYSPNKSRAGAIGSWAVGIPIALGLSLAIGITSLYLLVGLLAAPVVATFGDIYESATKRALGIKDFSKLLGARTGGLLDRVDSWLAAFAVAGVLVHLAAYV